MSFNLGKLPTAAILGSLPSTKGTSKSSAESKLKITKKFPQMPIRKLHAENPSERNPLLLSCSLSSISMFVLILKHLLQKVTPLSTLRAFHFCRNDFFGDPTLDPSGEGLRERCSSALAPCRSDFPLFPKAP